MYESFFNFRQRPFQAAPRADRYFAAGASEHAHQTLLRCVQRAAGPAMLIGPAGTGKTLLLQVLAEELKGEYRVAMLNSGRLCTRRALLQAILFDLGLPYRNLEEGELRLSLIDHLEPTADCPHGMLLLVDEAHTLPLRLLEEVRLITNLVRDGSPRVRLVLAGGPQLEERFASPKLEAFNQRIAARCYLESLTREETASYVRTQVSSVGGSPAELLTEDALRAIYDATAGIPRLINQVADHALMLAALGEQRRIGAAGIEEAWADLQQLPMPWNAERSVAGAALAGQGGETDGIVEFGQLDDEPSEFVLPAQAATPAPVARQPEAASLDDLEYLPGQIVDPFARLDRISAQVAALQQESAPESDALPATPEQEDEFHPAGTIGPEVELIFHGAHDPFAEHFAEEEVVIDLYASMEMPSQHHWPKVTSDEGRAIAALLQPQRAAVEAPVEVEPEIDIVEPPEDALQFSQYDRPQTDRAEPAAQGEDELAEEAAPAAQQPRRVAPIREEDLAHLSDDRDLIIVDDEPGHAPRRRAVEQGRRQEYRQLFARLRRG